MKKKWVDFYPGNPGKLPIKITNKLLRKYLENEIEILECQCKPFGFEEKVCSSIQHIEVT